MTMVSLDDILSEALKNPDVREAYEAEKKVLAEEVAEWERQKRHAFSQGTQKPCKKPCKMVSVNTVKAG
jgi:hypothetical protein